MLALAGLAGAEIAARVAARPWPSLEDFELRDETVSDAPWGHCSLRVLALGDSITYGKDVSYDQAYPAVLSRTWARKHPNDPVLVMNGGVNGFTVLQALPLLPLLDGRFRPLAVLIQFGINDCNLSRSVLDDRREQEFFVPWWVHALRHSRLFVGIERRWRRNQVPRAVWLTNRFEPRVSEAAFVRGLRQLVADVRKNHAIPLLLTTTRLPSGFRPELDERSRALLWESCERYNDLIRQVSWTEDAFLIDVHRELKLEPGDTVSDGIHLTVEGYRKLAYYLANRLDEIFQ